MVALVEERAGEGWRVDGPALVSCEGADEPALVSCGGAGDVAREEEGEDGPEDDENGEWGNILERKSKHISGNWASNLSRG